jgi:hypothetical protein
LLVASLLALGCTAHEDLAALIVGSAPDAGAFDAARPFDVIGRPWRGGRPLPVAPWPLATPLGDFFAGEREPSGRRVAVPGDDREALWSLRASVAAGDYGPPSAAVVVEDRLGDTYLIIFPADDE